MHQVAADPVTTALAFRAAGAQWIHMVDLDGARSGVRVNAPIVAAVARESGLKIELGGGLRTMEDLRAAADSGVQRLCIGSAAVSDPSFVAAAVREYGTRIAVGIDALEGTVRVSGWEQDSRCDCLDFCAANGGSGCGNADLYRYFHRWHAFRSFGGVASKLQQRVSCCIIASGGVSCNEDIRTLRDMGLYGAIIGKAYYAGTIDLALAIEEAGVQC